MMVGILHEAVDGGIFAYGSDTQTGPVKSLEMRWFRWLVGGDAVKDNQ